MANSANQDSQGYDPSQSYSDYKKAQDARSTQNNANNVRNAADVAIASKNPYAMAAGAAVKGADKLTGGKSTEAIGKAMTTANKITPGGNRMQNASNRLSESGASNQIGRAASMKNQFSRGGAPSEAASSASKQDTGIQKGVNQNQGGGQNGSLPSSNGVNGNVPATVPGQSSSAGDSTRRRPRIIEDKPNKNDDKEEDETSGKGTGKFLARQIIITVVVAVLPFLLLILLLIMIIAMVSGIFNDYQDAFGMSQRMGQETGGLEFTVASKEQEEFYDRVNTVVLSYQQQGISVDGMKIASIFHSLQANGVDIHYEDVSTATIQEWADATLEGGMYNKEAFRNQLINNIFPKYKPGEDKAFYEQMADEVFDYQDRYYDLIGNKQAGLSTGEFSQWKQGADEWGNVPMGNSGRTISQIGCLVTSVSMLIAKSGVPTNVSPFNPGTFVQYLNQHGGLDGGGNFTWSAATKVAPSFVHAGTVSVAGMDQSSKFNKIREIVSQNGVYAVAEVKGNTGQHWVAIDGISGSTINMMDPSSNSTDMWAQYNWNNTSTIVYYKVS